jgi:hypothetical protein
VGQIHPRIYPQAAIDAAHQVIVAQGLTHQASDAPQFKPMLAHSRANTGRQARAADAGYCSEHNPHGVAAPSRARLCRHGAASAVGVRTTVPRTRVHAMTRLKHAGYRRRDRLRKQVVASMFGQIKQARGFRPFLLRGLSQVAGEWCVVRGAQKF